MDLRQLRLFLAVAEAGNFTRAAERVNLSQPALTHRIRGLEDELGVSLLTRTARGASLTPAGEMLLEDARHLLEYMSASRERVRRAGGVVDQVARIGFDFAEFGGIAPMPTLLSAFRQNFPATRLEIETLTSDDLEKMLLAKNLDLAFVLGPPSRSGLSFHPLLRGQYRVVLPIEHPFCNHEFVTRSSLLTERLLLPTLNTRDDDTLLNYLRTADAMPNIVYAGAKIVTFSGLIAAGEGVALLPSGLAGLLGVGLVTRPLEDAPLWSFGLIWPDQQPTSFATQGQRLIRQTVAKAVTVE